jgi:ribosomal protein S18 acetylase RimI-like enzyme
MTIPVRDVAGADEAAWRDLWQQYVAFYQASVPQHVTERTWQRLLSSEDRMIGRVAEHDGRVAGFSVAMLHAGSWHIGPICYLEDLYVAPQARGLGIGRALIEDLLAMGRRDGWGDIYWLTRASNAAARRLYDSFVLADDFVRYRINLGE